MRGGAEKAEAVSLSLSVRLFGWFVGEEEEVEVAVASSCVPPPPLKKVHAYVRRRRRRRGGISFSFFLHPPTWARRGRGKSGVESTVASPGIANGYQ